MVKILCIEISNQEISCVSINLMEGSWFIVDYG